METYPEDHNSQNAVESCCESTVVNSNPALKSRELVENMDFSTLYLTEGQFREWDPGVCIFNYLITGD